MSQENMETVRLAFEAVSRRDKAAFLAMCDPEVETVPLRDFPESALNRVCRVRYRLVWGDRLIRTDGEEPERLAGVGEPYDDDVYVRHKGMRADPKTSPHASGANHHAWTPSGAARWKPDGDRYMMKWGEPEDFALGGKNLLGIVLPSDHLTVPEEEPPLAKREKTTS
jgi:hypothetical protein